MSEDLKNTPRRKQQGTDIEKIERVPPQALEAEKALLGCVMLSGRDVLQEIIAKIGYAPDVFYDLRNRELFDVMCGLLEDDVQIDMVTLYERLKIFGKLDSVGGTEYISSLEQFTPAAPAWRDYLDIIVEKYTFRKIIQVSTDAVSKAFETTEDPTTFLDSYERDVMKIRQEQQSEDTAPIKELVQRAMNSIEDSINRNGAITGLPTGFIDFDRYTMGLQPGQMIVIAARPSVGKTSLAMNIVEEIAVRNKIPTGVISLEMTGDQLTRRMVCSMARVNMRNVQEGFIAEREFPKLTSAASRISTAPLYIDDRSSLSIMQIRAKARRWAQKYGIKLLVIDYLQLAKATDTKRKYESRQQEISDISAGVKSIAKDLKIPVVVLSQLNRDIEREKNRKPRLSDLRESGSIEQDADFVGFLYRVTSEEEDDAYGSADAEQINLLIAKQREGQAGVDVSLTFLKSYTRFESAAKISERDVPEQGRFATADP